MRVDHESLLAERHRLSAERVAFAEAWDLAERGNDVGALAAAALKLRAIDGEIAAAQAKLDEVSPLKPRQFTRSPRRFLATSRGAYRR